MTKHLRVALAAILVTGSVTMHAQTTSAAPAPKKTTKTKAAPKPKPETPEQAAIRELQAKIAAQQAQIDALIRQNAAKDASLATAQQSAATAQSAADQAAADAKTAQAATQQQQDQLNAIKSNVTDIQTINTGLATTISANKTELNDKIDSPVALRYKGVTITPGGFAAFEGVYRERTVNSDINTPFNSIPFPSANEGHTSEFNMSGRQSRLSVLVEGDTGHAKLSGYWEMDWLGTGTTSNNNQSNSYVLRQRQIWGSAATKSGFQVTGGQMWSLATEDRKGLDPRTEIQPMTIDPQYVVGYTWTRQPEIRVEQHWGDYKTKEFTLGLSLEQAQITSFTANGTNPNQYFFGGLGQNGGLYNAAASAAGTPSCTANNATPPVITCTLTTSNITTYANNVAPDLIVKGSFDMPILHFEFGGIARWLRDQYFPVIGYGGVANSGTATYTYGTTYTSHTSSAGGGFGSIRGYIGKPGTYPALEAAFQFMGGTGVGRYGSSQLADATLRPDETLEPVKNYHGLFSLEAHLDPKFDIFAYYGGEYAQRTVYKVPGAANALIGYAPPNMSNAGCYNLPAAPSTGTIGNGGSTGSLGATTCNEPTKFIQEGVIGFQYRPIVSSKYGKLQYSATYSIINRQIWAGIGSATTPVSPRAQDSMIHFQMRYFIP